MGNAIGIVELSSIARGIETCDAMLKAAYVEVLRAAPMCPGKYLILIGGETGEVSASLESGKKTAGKYLRNSSLIANLRREVLTAITKKGEISMQDAVGVLEFPSMTSAILAADSAVKAAEIRLIRVRLGQAIGGKGVVLLAGEVSDIHAAVAAAAKQNEKILESAVIPHPSPQLLEHLC